MRSRSLLLALVASLVTLPSTGTAAHTRAGDPPDSARIRAIRLKAEASFDGGRIKEARNLYRSLVHEQRAAELYAGAALWRVAETYFAADDARGAAWALDEVAAEAARFGDPALELKASFEAALAYQQLNKPSSVALRLTRVKTLLQSPAVPQEQKERIESRMEK